MNREIERKIDTAQTCYLFFDFDGTVYLNHKIPRQHLIAMNAAQQLGHKLIVNTGRSKSGFKNSFSGKQIKWDGGIFGASDLQYEGRILERSYILKEDFLPWLELAMKKKTRVNYCGTEEVERFWFDRHPEEFTPAEQQEIYEQVDRAFVENPLLKITYWDSLAECDYPNKTLSVANLKTYMDIFPAGYNKGVAFLRYCEHLQIPVSQCVCFGDSRNDMDIFRVCPTSIAMRDSVDELKTIATYCAKTECGVSEGLEFLFGDKIKNLL